MSNLSNTVRQLANNCLLYVVNVNTGELKPMLTDEYKLTIQYQKGLVPYADPALANARSITIKTGLRRWEVAS